ncbi:MAG: trypsin-like peptidase domain-containing protein [Alphaproteobacteria bacterium]|nr:trypsin-like peptidase domain-containing protein [Alphaproteobacteria bacterium]
MNYAPKALFTAICFFLLLVPAADADALVVGKNALPAVMKVNCNDGRSYGTGFLHKSGMVVTAAHVATNCQNPELRLADGSTVGATVAAIDQDHDLALIKPDRRIPARGLDVSNRRTLPVGSRVGAWGYPVGYAGTPALLSVGYLSGGEEQPMPSGRIVAVWVVNAAFNSGSSGGPLIDIANGKVIGVVIRKLAPASPQFLLTLQIMSQQKSEPIYIMTLPDGEKQSFSEAQLLAMALGDLRGQVQLVLGEAVKVNDLRNFLKKSGIVP